MAEGEEGVLFQLPHQDIVVTTDVDKLIELLRAKREISLKEASEILSVTLETVESWARFLEEEGIVSLSYKFTTPFIIYQNEQEVLEQAPVKQESSFFEVQEGDVHKEAQPPKMQPLQTPALAKKDITLPKPAARDVRSLVTEAYQFIQGGEVKEAQRLYDKVREHLQQVPPERHEERKEIEHHLLKLNRDLALLMLDTVERRASETEAQAAALLDTMAARLDKEKYAEAEKEYAALETLNRNFPDELILRKLSMQKKILAQSKPLLAEKAQAQDKRCAEAVSRLYNALRGYSETAAPASLQEAMKALYCSLPESVLAREPVLTKEVLRTFPNLVTERQAHESVKAVRKHLADAQRHLQVGKVLEANRSYHLAGQTFEQVGQEFPEERLSLFLALHAFQGALLSPLTGALKEDFMKQMAGVDRQLKLAERYVAKGKLELAQDAYREVALSFTTLPNGFLPEMTQLRIRMLNIYKELLVRSDVSLLEHLSKPAEDTYRELLSHIMHVQAHVEAEKFELLPADYSHLAELYSRLPDHPKKSHLAEEIEKVRKMAMLYQKTAELQAGQPGAEWGAIKELYVDLLGSSPEAVPLCRYVHRVYSGLQKGQSAVPEQPPHDLPLAGDEHAGLRRLSGTELYSKAVIFLNGGDLEKAKQTLVLALEKEPGNQDLMRLMEEVSHLRSTKDLSSLLVRLKLDRAKYAASDDQALCQRLLGEVLRLQPDNAEAIGLLSKLKSPGAPDPAAEQQRKEYLSGIRVKEARLAASQGDSKVAERKMVEAMGLGADAAAVLSRLKKKG